FGDEAFRGFDRISGPTRRPGDSAYKLNIVAKPRHQISEAPEMRHRLVTGSVGHERGVSECSGDSRIDVPEFTNNGMELREIATRSRPGLGGIKSTVEDRPRDCRIGSTELLQ